MWNILVNGYELIPPLDNHMAITRFANMEVGALITTTQHLQTIQDLIGNSFAFDVEPFISNNNDTVQVIGNGLVVLNKNKNIEELFHFMGLEETQLDFLSKAGWFPTQSSPMENPLFMELPMSKYLNKLIQYEGNFNGSEITVDSRSSWMNIKNKALEIENTAY